MNKILLPLVALLTATGALSAQASDTISLTDGTTIRGVKVLSWDAQAIKYKASSGSTSQPAHLVKDASVESIREAMNKAGQNPESLVGEADTLKADKMVAPYLLHQAALAYYDMGKAQDMIAALQKIDADYPTSAFAPAYYQWKIRYYLSKDKPDLKSAATAAEAYGSASRTRTWSEAYQLDAEYWTARIEGAAKKVEPARFISNMKELADRAAGKAPFVAHAAQVDMADAHRGQKAFKEASAAYTKLADAKGLSANVRARMYLGLGYISLEDALAAEKPEEKIDMFHEAFKNFLRVYLNAKEADPELVAEGLYNAAKACEQWNQLPTCAAMAGRLRGRLKLRQPYMSTSWAKKK